MEIERINENTVKFFISYSDIEDRGFEREEIWYNRERSEQLFWQMMDEVNDEEDFSIDGPLWIQVKALEKGLEIVVSKANPEKELQDIFSFDQNDQMNLSLSNNDIEEMAKLKNEFQQLQTEETDNDQLVLAFESLEDLIQFSHHIPTYLEVYIEDIQLYHIEDQYQLYMKLVNDEDEMINVIYHIGSEFGEEVDTTISMLTEYGKPILKEKVLQMIRSTFD